MAALREALTPALAAALVNDDAEFVSFADPGATANEAHGWVAERNPCDGVKVHSRPVAGTSLRMYRAVGALPAPAAAAATALWDSHTRMQWDKSYEGIDDVVDYDFDAAALPAGAVAVTLARLKIKALLAISARDFLDLQVLVRDGGVYRSVAHSIEHPACPPAPAFVRGDVRPGSGWRTTPAAGDASSCVLTYVILTDIKGCVGGRSTLARRARRHALRRSPHVTARHLDLLRARVVLAVGQPRCPRCSLAATHARVHRNSAPAQVGAVPARQCGHGVHV